MYLVWKAVFCIFIVNILFSSENKINVNDILNEDYLPGKLVMETMMIDKDNKNNKTYLNSTTQGDFNDAFETMGFHRKMMNEYLCRSYIAEEILDELITSEKPKLEKRHGAPQPLNNVTLGRKRRPYNKIDLGAVKDSMLSDPGSSNYQNWLSRTTTLEDVYRHYEDDDDDDDEDLVAAEDSSHDDAEYAVAEDYDGEVTGFAMQHMQHTHTAPSYAPAPSPATSYGAPPHSAGSGAYGGSGAGSSYGGGGSTGYGGGGGGHSGGGHSGGGHSGGGDHSGGGGDFKSGGGGKDKMMKLKDLFNLALTAMAFLAFAMFKMQVIMCIAEGFMSSTTTQSSLIMMMMPGVDVNVPGGPGGIDINVPGGPGGIDINLPGGGRFRRSQEYIPSSSETNTVLNEMARRVLENMEAFYYIQKDDGECLRRLLCENNRYSKTLNNNMKVWLPVWSFGMSWISGRFSRKLATATAMLENLRASVLGLGTSKCDIIYPNCSRNILEREKENRRRKRRRRRRTENRPIEL